MIDKDKQTDEQINNDTTEETTDVTAKTEVDSDDKTEDVVSEEKDLTIEDEEVIEDLDLDNSAEDATDSLEEDMQTAEDGATTNTMHVVGEDNKKGGKGLIIAISLVAVLVVGVFGYLFATKSGPFASPSLDDQIVITVGDVEVSAAEYNYMYAISTSNFLTNNSSMLAYFNIDFTLPLSEQHCSIDPDVGTWADYFNELTLNTIHYNYGMLDAANKSGFEASEETYTAAAEALATLESAAANENLTNEEYVAEFIGEGITFETVSNIITTLYTVNEYLQSQIDAIDLSQDAIDAQYEENKDYFDLFTFKNMFFDGTVEGAKDNADEMFSRLDGENFKELSDEYLGEDVLSTLPEGYDYTFAAVEGMNLYDDELKAYLVDPSREAGDTTVVEIAEGYYVIEFVSREKNTAPASVGMKHLLIGFNEDGSEATQEQKDAALAEITALTEQWEAGGATDELFVELVTEHTDDMGSASTGGVYSNVLDGDMVTEINDFLFDPNTSIGDYEIIETVYGYHLTVLIEKGAEAWVSLVSDNLIDTAMINAENEVLETTEIVENDDIFEYVIRDIDLSDFNSVG